MIVRILWVLVLLLIAALPFFDVLPGWTLPVATLAAFTAILIIGLNIVFGLAGMLALGQAAFAAIAGYITGLLVQGSVPEPVSIATALVLTVGLAWCLAIVFVRLPGIYLAFGTLGFAFVTEGLVRAFPAWTGGASGLIFASDWGLSQRQWYVLSLLTLAAGLGLYAVLTRGAYARRLNLLRQDELAAGVLGVNVSKVKRDAFTLAAAYAAVAGILIAQSTAVLVPEMGGVDRSLDYIAMSMIGGAGSFAGPVLGASLINWLSAVGGRLGVSSEFDVLLYGVGFFVTAMFAPRGLAGLLPTWKQRPFVADPHSDERPEPATEAVSPLQIRGLRKSYGGLVAVHPADLDIYPGEVVVLIGPNGAGKTTLFNLVSGIDAADDGRIELGGKPITHLPIHQRARIIGRSFQVPRLVGEASVLENVVLRLDQIEPGWSERARLNAAYRQLERFGLAGFAGMPAARLSAGQQKLIDVARAALGHPELLLLDEPAVGLTETELAALADMIADIRRSTTVLLVEHNFRFVAKVARRAIVLDRGKIIADGPIEAVTAMPAVRNAYYGALHVESS